MRHDRPEFGTDLRVPICLCNYTSVILLP